MVDWFEKLKSLGGYWEHDGNLDKPFVEFTSGRISNSYCNCTVFVQEPFLLRGAVEDLLKNEVDEIGAVVGPAMSAVTLGYEFAAQLGCKAWYTEKSPEGRHTLAARFKPTCREKIIVGVDDAISTGGSILDGLGDIETRFPYIEVLPRVYCLVNRTSKQEYANGIRIISLMHITAKTWVRENPFTPDGQELVEPVKAKQLWEQLMVKE